MGVHVHPRHVGPHTPAGGRAGGVAGRWAGFMQRFGVCEGAYTAVGADRFGGEVANLRQGSGNVTDLTKVFLWL